MKVKAPVVVIPFGGIIKPNLPEEDNNG